MFLYFTDEVIKRWIFSFLPDKHFIVFDYFFTYGKFPNLQQPKSFNEKMQWIKINGGLEKYTKYVDKYEVRDFISKTIGKEYLVPLIGVWDSFDKINFDLLPRKFVLKPTHSSGDVFICKDKSSMDINKLTKTVTMWMQKNFYKVTREIQYRDCNPKIICEKYLEDESGGLTDYKIFYFNGKPRLIEVVSDRFSEMKDDFLDINWKILPIVYDGCPNSKKTLRKPKIFKEMVDISEKLSKKFPFVRVDLYLIKNKIYFGELTFTPSSGLDKFEPIEVDYQLGDLIDLSKYNNF